MIVLEPALEFRISSIRQVSHAELWNENSFTPSVGRSWPRLPARASVGQSACSKRHHYLFAASRPRPASPTPGCSTEFSAEQKAFLLRHFAGSYGGPPINRPPKQMLTDAQEASK